MSSFAVIIIVGVVLVGLFGVVDYIIRTSIGKAKIREAEEKAKEIIKSAERELEIRQKELEIKVQKELYESKAAFERSTRNIRREIEKKTKELKLLEGSLEKKADMIERKELALANREKSIQTKERALMMKEEELNNLIEIQNKKLEQIAGMTSEEAKKLLMDNLVNQARAEASQMIKEIREEAERRAEKEAKEIIISAIQRCSVDVTQESTVTVITLPSDELKGRVIGREGRNIRAFEIATGVDVIVDDTPEAIILSSFDPIKREIARLAMEKLITDGRI
ncbi:MAG: Rnase Y domain-containing protein, partial [bacterium]